jgi:hypothetical protein
MNSGFARLVGLGLAVVSLSGWMPAWRADAAAGPGLDALTVVYLAGKGFRKSAQGEWEALRPGERLPADAVVRTEPGGSLGLIASDGRVIRVAGGREQAVLTPDAGASPASALDALSELFADARRARLAKPPAGKNETAPTAEARLAQFYQSEWEDLMHYPRVASFDLSRALETVSYYGGRPRQNRAIALLLKIAADLPDSPGLSALAQSAARSYGKPAALTLLHHAAGSSRETRSGEMLRSGDQLQIRFHSDSESYLYLYLRSIPDHGAPVTARLFPAPGNEGAAIPPGAGVALPAFDDTYVLDDAIGQEFFWAWVCAAPLDDRELERTAVELVTNRVTSAEAFGDELPRNAAPQGCLQTFVFALDHR